MKNEFDFDDWAALYQRDPRAFESRRQMILAIELAKGGPMAAPARVALRTLEAQLENCSGQDRARKSFAWMVASMQQLSAKMAELSRQVTELNQVMAPVARPKQDRKLRSN